jgi:hypothetical protein
MSAAVPAGQESVFTYGAPALKFGSRGAGWRGQLVRLAGESGGGEVGPASAFQDGAGDESGAG